jgi:peroxiredoxin
MARVQLNIQAPDFTLTDFNGKSVSLADFLNKKNVLVVFNRGFFWPFCRVHMAQLRRDYQRFVKLDTEIIVAGPEKAEAFREYWAKETLPFIGLPDPEHKVLKLYGQQVKLFKLGRMPAQMLIDKSGKVRFVHYGHSMSDIPSNQEIIDLIEKQIS